MHIKNIDTLKAGVFILLISIFSSNINADPIQEQEQHERQKEIFESFMQDPTKNIERFELPKTSEVDLNKTGECFTITNITVNNSTLIDKNDIERTKNKYLNECNYLSDLKNLVNDINALYIEKGYITSQSYITSQDISSGNLTIEVIEGKVANIIPNETYINTAFFMQKEKPLNIRDIEVALENINRLSSNDATMKLAPSDRVGYTDIVVENDLSMRFGGFLGVDNYGSKRTGKAQASAGARLENIFNINDILNIYYNTSNKHFTDENSIGNGYDFSFPLGRATFTFSQRNNRYEQFVRTGASTFITEGRTKTYTFDTHYKLYHDQKHRLGVSASLSNYKTRNYFAGVHLDTSSYRLSKLGLSLDYLYQIYGFYVYTNLSLIQGVDLFNNYHNTMLDDDYMYYNFSLSAMKDFYPFRYTLNFYAQHTKDELFGADKISIGGPYSVRGFNKEGLSGNSGYYVRNELLYNSNFDILGGLNNSIFIALDGGAIKKDVSSDGGKLLGYAVGTKFNFKHLDATLQYSIPLYKKDVSKTQKFLSFSVRTKF